MDFVTPPIQTQLISVGLIQLIRGPSGLFFAYYVVLGLAQARHKSSFLQRLRSIKLLKSEDPFISVSTSIGLTPLLEDQVRSLQFSYQFHDLYFPISIFICLLL